MPFWTRIEQPPKRPKQDIQRRPRSTEATEYDDLDIALINMAVGRPQNNQGNENTVMRS